MSTGKKILAVILIAVMAFGFGLAGGLCADWIKEKINGAAQEPIQEQEETNAESAIHYTGDNSSVTVDQAGNVTINVSGDYTLAEAIADKVMPSVVSVTCSYEVSYSYGWGWGSGGSYTQEASSVGTGFIVDSNG